MTDSPSRWSGCSNRMASMVAEALASWIAARRVHRGAPWEFVAPVVQTPLPGLLSDPSPVEFTVTPGVGRSAIEWAMVALEGPVAVRVPVVPAPARRSSAAAVSAPETETSARSAMPAGGVTFTGHGPAVEHHHRGIVDGGGDRRRDVAVTDRVRPPGVSVHRGGGVDVVIGQYGTGLRRRTAGGEGVRRRFGCGHHPVEGGLADRAVWCHCGS